MNPTIPPTGPPRCGDKVQTLPCSGDHLSGRVNAVFVVAASRQSAASLTPAASSLTYYRVKFPIVSPYFREGDGVIYRAHEIALHIEAPEPVLKPKLPNRPKPTRTS